MKFQISKVKAGSFKLLSGCLLGFAASSVLGSAPAQALTIQASDTGWYREDGYHDQYNNNYISGNLQSTGYRYRSFFNFNLGATGLAESITSATLYTRIYQATTNSLITLFDYTGSIPSLLNGTGGTTAFADLGSGTAYGSTNVAAVDQYTGSNQFASFVLNQAAIAALNASLNGSLAIGAVNSNENLYGQYVYGWSGGYNDVYLDVQTTPATPVPGPLPILGVAAAFGYSRKLRKRINDNKSSDAIVIN